MPPQYEDMSREQIKEEKKKHAAAKKHLSAAVKAFKASKKTDDDKRELEEVVVSTQPYLGHGDSKMWTKAQKDSDTFKRGGRHTRRHRSRRRNTRR